MSKKPAGELFPGNSVFQAFELETPHLAAISIVIGTFASRQNCHLKFSLYELPRWRAAMVRVLSKRILLVHGQRPIEQLILPERFLVAETVIDCDGITDNSPVDLLIDPRRKPQGGIYLLRICSPDGVPGEAVTAWLSNGPERIQGHAWCAVGGSSAGRFGIMGRFQFTNPIADSPVPPSLCISTATQCNLNCIHCISRSTRTRVNRLGPEIRAEIQRWADQGLLQSAATDYSGDLLWADERFGGDLDFFLGLNVPFHLDTNGVCLHRETARRLVHSRVASINVSLDAARDETFRRIRVGAPPLEQIIEKMRGLAEERRTAGRMEITLSISFSLMRSNLEELPEVLALAREVGFDLVTCRHVEAYTPDMADESLWHDQAGFNRARKRAIRVAKELGIELGIPTPFEFAEPKRGHHFCPEPWRSALVLGNGDVQVCCVPGPEMRMGNLHEQTMEEIWNGPRYQQFRIAVNSSKPPAACNACPIYRLENNPDSYMPFRIHEEPLPAPGRRPKEKLVSLAPLTRD